MSLTTAEDKILDGAGALVIGLTGGMGAGKSVVAQILRSLGHPVFDADAVARSLYEHDAALLEAVVERFGSGVLNPNGTLSRGGLAAVVFSDPEALADLNAMVHPAVSRAFTRWKSVEEKNGAAIVFREAAILFESGSEDGCDLVWAVSAPMPLRVQRVCARNGWGRSEVQARIAHQWPAEKVNAKADQVIVNDGSHALIPVLVSLMDDLS